MRDVEDGEPLVAKPSEDVEEDLDAIGGEAARGLVEDKHAAFLMSDRASDLDELASAGAEALDARADVDVIGDASADERLEGRAGGDLNVAPREEAAAGGFAPEDDVLGDGEVRAERE